MMRVAMRLMCLWPGLPQLWWRGQVSWLLVAVGFAGLINLAIASSVLCPGLLPPAGVLGVWCAAAGLWGLSLWQSQQHWEQILPTPSGAAGEALFATAQTQYLRGDWEEVEALAAGVLQQHPDDVEFRLLLAAVQRRTGKWVEARRTFQDALQWEGGEHWKHEIQRELAWLEQRQVRAAQTSPAKRPGKLAETTEAAEQTPPNPHETTIS